MNDTIRANHLGLAPPIETARQFQLKVAISLVVISMATTSIIWQDTFLNTPQRCQKNKTFKIKAKRAKRKIQNLLDL
jgi:hypothetical protein